MNSFNSSDQDIASVQCAVCEKEISGGKWFARIRHGDLMLALCCPLCTEVFQSNPRPYARRIETLAEMASRQHLDDAQAG